jgi:hypothetical protein
MSEIKLPTIRPSTPAMMVNASSEDSRRWGNVYIVAVSVKTNPLAGYIGADLPSVSPCIKHAPINAAEPFAAAPANS